MVNSCGLTNPDCRKVACDDCSVLIQKELAVNKFRCLILTSLTLVTSTIASPGMTSPSFFGVECLFADETAAKVEMKPASDTMLDIQIAGKPFATFNFGHNLPKPFLLPVRTASGTVLNRALDDKLDADHPHHKGLWISIDEVNDQKFWAEKSPIVNVSVKSLNSGSEAATLEVVNEWRRADNQAAVVVENTKITIHANRLLVYDITFTAAADEVVFEDTKEGLLGFRVAPSMKEKNGGKVVSSDGTKGSKDCWGKTFPWIDYYGSVDGRTVGVTLMDHPSNLRPSRYHVRDYGLFSISPFGEKSYTNGAVESKPLHLKKSETFRLRYGVYLHDGDTETANVAGAFEHFLKSAD